jgi:hypothetical protein
LDWISSTPILSKARIFQMAWRGSIVKDRSDIRALLTVLLLTAGQSFTYTATCLRSGLFSRPRAPPST